MPMLLAISKPISSLSPCNAHANLKVHFRKKGCVLRIVQIRYVPVDAMHTVFTVGVGHCQSFEDDRGEGIFSECASPHSAYLGAFYSYAITN